MPVGKYPREKGSQAPWHADAIKMFKAGRKQSEIARKYGVSRERVHQILVGFGGHVCREDTTETRNRIKQMYAAGKCIDEIAKTVEREYIYVTRVLKRDGVAPIPGRQRLAQKRILKMADKGKTAAEIIHATGYSDSAVRLVLNKTLGSAGYEKLLVRKRRHA